MEANINENKLLQRITTDPDVMTGKPVIKGTRLTVHYILKLLSNGEAIEAILEEYEGLSKDDILACVLFAAKAMESSSFYPFTVKAV